MTSEIVIDILQCGDRDRLYYNNNREKVPGCQICAFNMRCSISAWRPRGRPPKEVALLDEDDKAKTEDEVIEWIV